jgi:predicted ATPase
METLAMCITPLTPRPYHTLMDEYAPHLPDVQFPIMPSAIIESGPDRYPYNIPALKNLRSMQFHPHVTFFVGENGSGKSTLLEALAVNMGNNPEGGNRNFRFETRRTDSAVHSFVNTGRGPRGNSSDTYFFRAESFYNLASNIDDLGVAKGYGGKSLHAQSHGESFFALFDNRFRQNCLYFLDEPEAALSPKRQMSFIALLHRLVLMGSQFVIATHSPIILAYPYAWMYSFDSSPPKRVNYEETEHFQVTKMFLTFKERMLKELMTVDEEEMGTKPTKKRRRGR